MWGASSHLLGSPAKEKGSRRSEPRTILHLFLLLITDAKRPCPLEAMTARHSGLCPQLYVRTSPGIVFGWYFVVAMERELIVAECDLGKVTLLCGYNFAGT